MFRQNRISALFIFVFMLSLLFYIPPSYAYNYFDLHGIKGYKPPEGWDHKAFNWKPPYTAHQIMYIANAHRNDHNFQTYAFYAYINRNNHIRYNHPSMQEKEYYDNYGDLLDYEEGKIKAGDIKVKNKLFFYVPKEVRGLTTMAWDYFDTPYKRKDADRWLYLSSLRRIRRLAGSEREDPLAGGSDQSNDDIQGREIFEEEHRFLGEDLLYPEDFNWHHWEWPKYNYELWKSLPGNADVPEPKDIRFTKPIPCWVIEAKSKLPDYYLSKRILWVKKSNNPQDIVYLREEQYDKKGFLWKINDWAWYEYPIDRLNARDIFGRTIPGGAKSQTVLGATSWDLKIDHRTILYVFYWAGKKGIPIDEFWLMPDVMPQERLFMPEKEIPTVRSVYDLPERPPLLLGRFEKDRPIEPKLLEYLKDRIVKEKEKKKTYLGK